MRKSSAMSVRAHRPALPARRARASRPTGRATSRRGFTSVLAMLFLVLLSTLALGFFAEVSTSVQIADNEKSIGDALFSAESGLQFLRYQMSAVKIPPGTAANQIFTQVASQLKLRLDNSSNLNNTTLSYTATAMSIPTTGYVLTDSTTGAGFRVDLSDPTGSGNVTAVFTGRARTNGLTRQIKLVFGPQNSPTTVFNFAIAAQGQIDVTKDKVTGVNATVASLMSTDASPAIKMSGGLVGGTLNVTVSKSYALVTGGSVNGDTNVATILANDVNVVQAPEFPKVDTTAFKAFATNQYSTWKGGSPYSNLYVKKTDGARFAGGDVINGILYIESGANVTFRGNVTVNGIIVVENANTANYSTVDTLSFNGDVSQNALPASATYDSIRAAAKGYSIIAPTTAVSLSGNVHSTLTGTAIVGTMALGGSADIAVNNGSMISYSVVTDADVLGGKTISFTGLAKDNPPTFGLNFSQLMTPTANTYEELAP